MTTRVIFNGQEYSGIDAMPEHVRAAYLKALELFKDADGDGIPDVLEKRGADTVIGIQQSSVTLNGLELSGMGEVPTVVRRVVEAATGSGGGSSSKSTDEPEPPQSEASGVLHTAQSTLGVLLAFLAGFILIFSVGLMLAIGGGRDHLVGRLTVAIGALLLLAWLDTHASRLAQRRRPLLGPDSPGYRRFVMWSAFGLVLAAALLLGLAWFLPP